MRVTEHLEHDASDSAITRVVEHYERLKSCYEQSASCGEPTAGTEFSPLPMGPLSPETGGTTAAIGRESTEPPYGGWDEVPERIPRAWQDEYANDVGVPRDGPI